MLYFINFYTATNIVKNKVSLFIKENYDKLILLSITILSGILIYLPFFLYNNLLERDLAGHTFSAWYIKEYLLPGFSGWNPFHFLGFPQGETYPFLFHYITAILAKIFGVDTAFKLVVLIIGLTIPYSIFYFSSSIFKIKKHAILLTVIIYFILLMIPGYLAFNIKGSFTPGFITSFVSIPLVFFYLGSILKKNKVVLLPSFILSLTILTHIISSLVLISFSLFIILTNLKKKEILLSQFKILLLTFSLTTFYTLPYLAFRSYILPPKTDPISIYIFLLIIAMFVVTSFTSILTKKKKLLLASLMLFLFTTILTLGSYFNIKIIQELHPYRFVSYLFIIAVGLLFYLLVKKFHSLFIRIDNYLVMIMTLLTIGIILTKDMGATGPGQVEMDLGDYRGRFASNYRTDEILNQTRAPYYQPIYANQNISFIMGQFEESSYNAPYLRSLSWGYIENSKQYEQTGYIEDKRFSLDEIKILDDFFGVNYSINTGEFSCVNSENKDLTKIETSCLQNKILVKECETILKVCHMSDSPMLAIWTKDIETIKNNWDKEVESWWINSQFKNKILVSEEIPLTAVSGSPSVTFINNSKNWDNFEIKINSDRNVPTIIKMSYFPKWHAYKNGEEIKIYRVSPNIMLVNSFGEIKFTYEETVIEKFSVVVSIITFLTVLFYLSMSFVKKMLGIRKI